MKNTIKILLAIDNLETISNFKSLCKKQSDIELRVVKSAKSCLSALKNKRYDILILAYRLPDSTGTQILSRIFKINSDQIVIFLADHTDEETVIQHLKSGIHDYVIKRAGYERKILHTVKKSVYHNKLKDEKELYEAKLNKLNKELNSIVIEKTRNLREEIQRYKESEQKFKTLTDTSSSAIFIYQKEKFVYVNKFAAKLTGYSKKELLNKRFWDVVHPEFKQLIKNRGLARQRGTKIPQRYEFKIICKNGKEKWVDFTAGLISFEGKPAAIGTAFDITPSKLAEIKLRQSETRFKDLATLLPQGIYEMNLSGRLTFVNNALLKLFGYTSKDIAKGLRAVDTIHPDDRKKAGENLKRVLNGEINHGTEYIGIRKDKTKFPVMIYSAPIYKDGKIAGIRGTIIDISERKKFESTITNQLNEINLYYDNAPVGLAILDTDLRFLKINNRLAEINGLSTSEHIGKSIKEIFPSLYRLAKDITSQIIKTGNPVTDIELTGETNSKTGVQRIWLENWYPLKNENNSVTGFSVMVQEITERKNAENALKESENKFRSVIEEAVEIVFTVDNNGYFTYVNPAGVKASGYTLDELTRLKYIDLIEPEYKEKVRRKYLRQFLERDSVSTTEYPFRTKTGEIKWFNQNTRLIIENDQVMGFYVIARDVTERRKAEEALQESEEKYRILVENMGEGVMLTDNNDVIKYINKRGCNIFGYKPEELLGKTGYKILEHPDYKNTIVEKTKDRLKRISDTYKVKGIKKTGELIWVRITLTPIFDNIGNVTGSVGIFTDITNIKKIQEELVKSKEIYKAFFEDDLTGDFISTTGGRLIDCNPAYLEMLGFKNKEEALNFDLNMLYPKISDRQKLIELVKENGKLEDYEYTLVRIDGSPIYVIANIIGYFDSGGNLETIKGYIIDNTKRKLAELELRKLSEAVKQSPASIIITDLGGNIQYVNKTFEDITGYTSKEVAHKNPRFLKSGATKKEIYENLWATILAGKTWRGELMNKKKNGELYWEDAVITPIKDEKGSTINYLGIKQDITGRKKYEEDLNKYINELVALHEASNAFTISSSLKDTGEQIIDTIERVMNWKRGSIWIKNGTQNKIRLLAHSRMGLDSNSFYTEIDKVNNLIVDYGDGVSGCVILHGKPIRLGNVKKDPRYIMADPKIQSELCVPMSFGGEIIGCINVESETKDAFSEHDEILLTTIANQAAVAIKNAALYENLKNELEERERAEKEATVAKEKAEAANKLKSEFLAQISHEIRTPLNAVLSYSGLLRDDICHGQASEYKDIFDGISNSGSRIIRTIDLILNAAELQTGTYEYLPREFDLYNDVITKVGNDLRIFSQSKNLDLRIVKQTDDTSLSCDEFSVYQIFLNLIDNAIKYSEVGFVEVRVLRNKFKKLQVEIEDTGIGIEKDFIGHLFEPFTQEETGYSRKFEGTGLGLALVKQYCDMNNADISVKSEKGVGSVFTVTFNA